MGSGFSHIFPGLVNAGRTEKSEGRARKRKDNKVVRRGRRMAWLGQKSIERPQRSPAGRVTWKIGRGPQWTSLDRAEQSSFQVGVRQARRLVDRAAKGKPDQDATRENVWWKQSEKSHDDG